MLSNNGLKLKFNSSNRNLILIIIAAVLTQLIFIAASSFRYNIGFPLDDAWIHQTYARNFAQTLRWEYIPGIISGGSTSPLWTFLLVPGHLFRNDFYLIWTFAISNIFFVGSAIVFEKILRLNENYSPKYPVAGILFCLEWHLAWAVCSGMETILYIFLILIITYILLNKGLHYWQVMILISLLVWVRPDGLTLLGPWILLIFFDILKNKLSLKSIIPQLIILIFSIALYMVFNYLITGSFFPNTFYAKQAEYAIYSQATFLSRLSKMMIIPLTGIGVLLTPGFIYHVFDSVRKRDIKWIGMILWFFGYLSIYAARLPVTYQHGRYIIPAIPVFLITSLFGYYNIQVRKSFQLLTIIKKAWNISSILILFVFFYLGFDAYSSDVAIIESEMVKTSKWVKLNTESGIVIGAHDIGALGFFGERKIIDLAGLITPDVIPFIRDEERLAKFLDNNNVDLLMSFPGWYNNLELNKEIIYSTGSIFSPKLGGENMTLYNWKD